MNIYNIISKAYDLLDIVYFNEIGKSPRQVIMNMIPNSKINILDMCCGTLSNTITIANCKPDTKVVGLDLSKDMLRVAKKKLYKQQIKNVYLKCADATRTKLKEQSFDYIIIGLVLHECSPELVKGMLHEAYRLLKDNGHLIVLEWEPPKKFHQIVKFFPLYLGERVNCKTFKQFYTADKALLFRKYGFITEQKECCNYSIVLNMKKDIKISPTENQ
ncbi:MAG: class I SAM-dependent methyltransferase [Lachnospiraceae bacterium]|nr:class I SAM-dependent methyltransferase [Lachnospiraceae bacterium]